MIPTVSVIIPSYNKAKFIKDTLQSVLGQTYTNWECLIVDDASTDDSISVINEFTAKDNRFILLPKEEKLKKGPSSSRNIGIREAKGEYIVFLDADDLLATDCLENRIRVFRENNDNDFLVFQMQRFVKEPDYLLKKQKQEINKDFALQSFICLHSAWPITGPIYKTPILRTVGGFQENLMNFEDFELAVKILLKAKSYTIFETIDCYYRNDEDYAVKYTSFEAKKRMMTSFADFVESINAFVIAESIAEAKKSSVQGFLVSSYKKVFRAIIIEDVQTFRIQNKQILDFLSQNGYLKSWQRLKYYFVQHVLFSMPAVKGIGLYRLIKRIYK